MKRTPTMRAPPTRRSVVELTGAAVVAAAAVDGAPVKSLPMVPRSDEPKEEIPDSMSAPSPLVGSVALVPAESSPVGNKDVSGVKSPESSLKSLVSI
jgi:hypothetical protein